MIRLSSVIVRVTHGPLAFFPRYSRHPLQASLGLAGLGALIATVGVKCCEVVLKSPVKVW